MKSIINIYSLPHVNHEFAILCFLKYFKYSKVNYIYLMGGARGKEPTCQCRKHKRCALDPWVGKMPWRRKWQTTPVFLPRESHG